MTNLHRRIALGAACVLMAAACGSTAQTANQAGSGLEQPGPGTGGSGPGTGLEGPAVGGSTQPGSTGGSTGLGSTGSTASGGGSGFSPTTGTTTGGGATGGSTGGTTGAGGTSGTGGGVGPGVTATEIRLGVSYCDDCAATNTALGAGGEDPGDTRRYQQAAMDDVNNRGGVLGRKLVPVWHKYNSSQDASVIQQEACETWTKDNKVFGVILRGDIIFECAKKAGIFVGTGGAAGSVFERFPNIFAPGDIRFERLASATVKAMVKVGWHKPEPKWPTGKIGIISWDTPEYRYAMDKGWLPSLRGAGLKETYVSWVAAPQSASSISDAGPAISAAVLKFQELGIDHVFIADGPAGIFAGTGLTLLFLQTAESQRYYPRYGFNTNNSPGFKRFPPAQLVGMLAITSASTDASGDEGIALNPQRERCFAVMKAKGLPVGAGTTRSVALVACEIAWFTEAIAEASRSTLLPDVIAGGESLGTSYRSPFSYGTKFGPGLHDGVLLFRNLKQDESCACLKYTSKPYEP